VAEPTATQSSTKANVISTKSCEADSTGSKVFSGSGFLNQDDRIASLDGRTVGDFWQWAYSDVLSNRNRSIFAEFIVGVALGVVDRPSLEWDSTDLCYRGFSIEVSRLLPVKAGTRTGHLSFDLASARLSFGI
jgi:hypothetical protein